MSDLPNVVEGLEINPDAERMTFKPSQVKGLHQNIEGRCPKGHHPNGTSYSMFLDNAPVPVSVHFCPACFVEKTRELYSDCVMLEGDADDVQISDTVGETSETSEAG